jgi:uncharacterized Zn finger protein (UPF0148 family)
MILVKTQTGYCTDCGGPIHVGRLGRYYCKNCETSWKDRIDAAVEKTRLKSAARQEQEKDLTREY